MAEECVANMCEEALTFGWELESGPQAVEARGAYSVEIAHGLVVGVVQGAEGTNLGSFGADVESCGSEL